nr:MAG TPA: helix-turn-helix protein [Caudoviricetes sp.]
MKRVRYTFNFKPSIYNFVLTSIPLNEYHKEKEILELLVKGYSCIEIGDKLGYSERTIKRRRRSIYEKTKEYMI